MKYYFEPATAVKSPYGTSAAYIKELADIALRYMDPREASPMTQNDFEPDPGKAKVRVLQPHSEMSEFEINTHAKLALLLANYFPTVPSRSFQILKADSLHLQRLKAYTKHITLCLVLQGIYDFSFINENTSARPTDDPLIINAVPGTAFVMDADCWHTAVRVDGKDPLVMLQIDIDYGNDLGKHGLIGRIVSSANNRSRKHIPPDVFVDDPNVSKPYLEIIA